MNNNPHYESDILFNDACYVAEQNLSLSLEEVEKMLSMSDESSLAIWTGLNCLRLFKIGEHNHFNGLIYSIVQHLIRETAPQ